MKKLIVILIIMMFLAGYEPPLLSQTKNEADTEICETFKYALINSLREPIDKAIHEIYKDDENAPKNLMWAPYNTEILKIRQLHGVGGSYEIKMEISPYYRAHITYGEDIVVVSTDGTLISYEHLKTYPRVDFN
ncbi:DUF3888 domain-containing protein [Alkalibacillus sp. S2W]|uniref:DUF3888 domain-containing protein n=1 Tax=Alkalibacillus sp. S2W TaxID=3386553 RepID=UPI00398D4A73